MTPSSEGFTTIYGLPSSSTCGEDADCLFDNDHARVVCAVGEGDMEKVQSSFDELMGWLAWPGTEPDFGVRHGTYRVQALERCFSSKSAAAGASGEFEDFGMMPGGANSNRVATLRDLAEKQLKDLAGEPCGSSSSLRSAEQALQEVLAEAAGEVIACQTRDMEELEELEARLQEKSRSFMKEVLDQKQFKFRYKHRDHSGLALHIAALHEHGHRLMTVLLDLGVTVNKVCKCTAHGHESSSTALHLAAGCGRTEVLKILVQRGMFDVNVKSRYKRSEHYTALHEASFFQQTDAARYLLQQGAEPDARNLQMMTPLHVAAKQGAWQVAQALVNRSPDLKKTMDNQGDTPLTVAIENGHFPKAKLYILSNATIDDVLLVAKVSPSAAVELLRAGHTGDEVHPAWRDRLKGHVEVRKWIRLMEIAPAAAEDILGALTQVPHATSRSENPLPRQAVFRTNEAMRCAYRPECEWGKDVAEWQQKLAPPSLRAWWGRPAKVPHAAAQVHPELGCAPSGGSQGPRRSSTATSLVSTLTLLVDNLRGQVKLIPARIEVVCLPGLMSLQVLHALANTNHMHVFSQPPVRAIVQHVWSSNVRTSYMMSILYRMIALSILFICVLKPDFAESEKYRRATWSFLCAHAFEELLYELTEVYGVLFVLSEREGGTREIVLQVLHFFWKAYLTNIKNAFDITLIGLNLLLMATSMEGPRLDRLPSVLALVSAAGWFQLMYTLRAFKTWGYRLLPLTQSLLPMSGTFCITVFFFLGFSHGFLALNSSQGDEARTKIGIFLAMFRFLVLGDLDDEDTAVDILDNYGHFITFTFFVACTFVFSIFILNLFITTTGEAYDKAQELCLVSFQQERASICLQYMLRPSCRRLHKACQSRWQLRLLTVVLLLGLLPLWYFLLQQPGVPICATSILLLAFIVLFDAVAIRHPWCKCPDESKGHYLWMCRRADFDESEYWPVERGSPRAGGGLTAGLKQDNMQRADRFMKDLSALRRQQFNLQNRVERDVVGELQRLERALDRLLDLSKAEQEQRLHTTIEAGALKRSTTSNTYRSTTPPLEVTSPQHARHHQAAASFPRVPRGAADNSLRPSKGEPIPEEESPRSPLVAPEDGTQATPREAPQELTPPPLCHQEPCSTPPDEVLQELTPRLPLLQQEPSSAPLLDEVAVLSAASVSLPQGRPAPGRESTREPPSRALPEVVALLGAGGMPPELRLAPPRSLPALPRPPPEPPLDIEGLDISVLAPT